MGFLNNLFGSRKKSKSNMPPELNAVMERLAKFFEDEDYQNSLMNPLLGEKVKNGFDVDELPHGIGEFGRTPENPIPVSRSLGYSIICRSEAECASISNQLASS